MTEGSTSFAAQFLGETAEIAKRLDSAQIDRMAAAIAAVRERGGRLFLREAGSC